MQRPMAPITPKRRVAEGPMSSHTKRKEPPKTSAVRKAADNPRAILPDRLDGPFRLTDRAFVFKSAASLLRVPWGL